MQPSVFVGWRSEWITQWSSDRIGVLYFRVKRTVTSCAVSRILLFFHFHYFLESVLCGSGCAKLLTTMVNINHGNSYVMPELIDSPFASGVRKATQGEVTCCTPQTHDYAWSQDQRIWLLPGLHETLRRTWISGFPAHSLSVYMRSLDSWSHFRRFPLPHSVWCILGWTFL